ncbi:MAG: hypothetical protein AAB575_03690 [Patescibacteria group bacterium]
MIKSVVLLIAVLSCLIGCGRSEPIVFKTIPHGSTPSTIITYQIDKLISHGNGVYYFNTTGDSFGKSLSSFIEAHSELEFVSMAPQVSGYDGCKTDGYFVVFRLNANR